MSILTDERHMNNGAFAFDDPGDKLTENEQRQLEELMTAGDGPQFNWDEDSQRCILGLILGHVDYVRHARKIVQPTFFKDTIHQQLCRIAFTHFDKYKAIPDRRIVLNEINEGVTDPNNKYRRTSETTTVYERYCPIKDFDYYLDQINGFARKFGSLGAVTEFVEGLKAGSENAREVLLQRLKEVDDAVDGWKEPLDPRTVFNSNMLPTFPIDGVAPIVPEFSAICSDVAHYLQVPPDLPACLALAAMGVGTAGRVSAEIRPGKAVPAVIWSMCVLPSGEMKSPTMAIIRAPITEFEQKQLSDKRDDFQRQKSERTIAKRREESLLNKIGKLKGDELREVENELFDLGRILCKPEPTLPRLLIDDATPEAVIPVLAQQSGRIACLADEATFLEVATGRYSGKPNLELYLHAWSGEPYTVDRVGKEPVVLPQTFLTLGLAVQPDVLTKMTENDEAADRGFLPRFLMAMPESRLGSRNRMILDPFPAESERGWRELIWRLLSDKRKRVFTLNFKMLGEWEQRYEAKLGPNKELNGIASWCGKAISGQAVRIAAVLHAASGSDADLIPDVTLRAAMEIVEYYLEHTKRIHQVTANGHILQLALKIRDYVATNHLTELRWREITHNPARRDNTDAIMEACGLLEECHVLKFKDTNKRKNPNYYVNPCFGPSTGENGDNGDKWRQRLSPT
jgi:hypothetical protein